MDQSGDSLDGDEYPGRMLQQAALYNNKEFMESLLQGSEKDHINAQDPYGRTALYTSVTNNSLECGHMLLQAGADANIACGTRCGQMTPLHAAALDNKQKFVSILLQYGANVNLKDASGKKPLDLAEKNRSEECLAILRSEIEAQDRQKMVLYNDFTEACTRGLVDRATELSTQMSEPEILKLVNDIPDNGNSLLYKACENGHVAMCDLLLRLGADVQVHPVTGHSPLHGACLKGQEECVMFMLKFFPELIRAPTIDGTFPLHIACSEGHTGIVDLLLKFNYPDLVKKLFKESHGDRMYRLGLALNAKDGHGRTPLHIAVSGNHVDIVKRLLEFRVSVALRYHPDDGRLEEIKPEAGSPEREGGAPKAKSPEVEEATEKVYVRQSTVEQFCPVEVDLMDLDGYTPLHLAVMGDIKQGYHQVASLLLHHKANPNEPFKRLGGQTSPLMDACTRGDVKMMEMLLKHGAKDDEQQILTAAVKSMNNDVIGAIIQYRSHGDSEYKVNYIAVMEETLGREDMTSSTSLKALWPNNPVTINWHGLALRTVELDWMVKSCLLHVGKPPPSQAHLALYAITRIDISNNKLMDIPQEIFCLPSLRILNASHNRIRSLLPAPSSVVSDTGIEIKPSAEKHRTGSDSSVPPELAALVTDWHCPLLEEVHLAKNKLRSVPAQLFSLPSLTKVTLAHNEITALPFEMWTCPSLTDLNLSHNLLQSLPHSCNPGDCSLALHVETISLSSADSPATSSQNTPVHLSYSPRTNTSDASASPSQVTNESLDDVPESLEISISTLKKNQQEIPIKYHTHWQDKVKVRVTAMQHESRRDEKQTKLLELNLSHNKFDNVPLGMACLTPHLTKLNLSHNLLKHVGPMENYPAGLKILDLSHNRITNDVLFECGTDADGPGSWAIKTCYNPLYQTRGRSMSKGQSSARMSSRSGRAGSSASLQSLSSVSGPQYVCVHRMHKQLEKLRTLKLSSNKLARLVLTLTIDVDEDSETSNEAIPSPRRERLSSTSDTSESQRVELFYPNLSVLDVSYNSLVTLPTEISELSQLAELKVANNRIKEFPPDMGLLRKLWNLDYRGCPVENNLQALLGDKAKKTSAVLSYLKSIKEEATLYNRMKLMFVGIQGIGKTSILSQLRREGKSNPHLNWAQRMGHSTQQDKDHRGENISTVGVDIGDLVLQRNNREIVFSTWDFGGQKEYYATHQYFLSKRSLYLVVWKVTDGEKGVNEIQQWLVNIQARAPNSPVIIVGTHLDLITKKKYSPTYLQDLHRMIFEKYVAHTEPEKSGLPRVLGCIEVSCKPRIMFNDHISDLVNMIWTVTCEEQLPGNRGQRLIDQKVPASYVHLQDVVRHLAEERKKEGKDPVLHSEQYKPLVVHKMEEMYNMSFRDVAELNQATQFLHDNGVLLHYDDVNLQDIYFLDPQWLCDMLANVVTIREINSLAKYGIMRTDDLRILFKNAAFKPEDIKTYVINLLNKFEVALLWDEKNLLIPSLLPTEMESRNRYIRGDVRVPLKGVTGQMSTSTPQVLTSNVVYGGQGGKEGERPPSYYIDPAADEEFTPVGTEERETSPEEEPLPLITNNPNPAVSIVRLYLMAYFPSGFWPRLITRLLADETLYPIVKSLYRLPDVLAGNPKFMESHYNRPEWKCWQTGLELVYMGVVILRMKEVPNNVPSDFCDYRQCKLVIKQDNDVSWTTLNLAGTSILEILIPNESLTVSVFSGHGEDCFQTFIMQPVTQVAASFLAKAVEHIDTLLEDWYPDLGARFVQNAKGMYLITRVVPCSRCLLLQIENQTKNLQVPTTEPWSIVEVSKDGQSTQIVNPQGSPGLGGSPGSRFTTSVDLEGTGGQGPARKRVAESAPAGGYMEAALGGKDKPSPKSSPAHRATAQGAAAVSAATEPTDAKPEQLFCYLVEQCLQAAQSNRIVFCPNHGNLGPYFVASRDGHVQHAHVAPDSVFQDIGEDFLVYQDLITRGRFLGKGAFGAVYAGNMVEKKTGNIVNVAMKMLQPVKPEPGATPSQVQQYEVDKIRWDKDPMKNACEAYLNARKELTILLSLHHENIVPLLGVSLQPLCLILRLAPLGALSDQLSEYRRAGARLPIYVITTIIKQVASALDYLHSNQIIYRDLKSENVLVWKIPPPHCFIDHPIDVKLADYGVSRTVLPSGTKGLAGTPPFIAPEIIQHNGEESYTEKVDCFSFGMFLYELLVLRLPFEGEGTAAAGGANLKGHILAGGRPSITNKEICYPTHIIDLMTLCWANDPGDRPSAAEILSLAETPSFSHLYSVMEMSPGVSVLCACAAHIYMDMAFSIDDIGPQDGPGSSQSDLWIATKNQTTGEGSLLVYTYHQQECSQARRLSMGGIEISCMCVADQWVWCADSSAVIHVFSQEEYVEVLKFPATTRPNVRVKCMGYGESQVYVVMDNGRFILCETQFPIEFSVNYSPVKTECPGNNKPIHCLGVLQTSHNSSELWCGQAGGRISIWDLHSTQGSLRKAAHTNGGSVCTGDVINIATCRQDPESAWSYVYPGTVVYRWDTASLRIDSRLDIKKYGVGTGHNTSPTHIVAHSQVTSMNVINKELYIGTTAGCLIVADKVSMLPLSICQSHSPGDPYVHSILYLNPPALPSVPEDQDPGSSSEEGGEGEESHRPVIVTIGRGYKDDIGQVLPGYKKKIPTTSNNFILTWSAEFWEK